MANRRGPLLPRAPLNRRNGGGWLVHSRRMVGERLENRRTAPHWDCCGPYRLFGARLFLEKPATHSQRRDVRQANDLFHETRSIRRRPYLKEPPRLELRFADQS